MKMKILKAAAAAACLVSAGSIAAGIADRSSQVRAEAEGCRMHKPYGIYEKYLKRPLDFGLSVSALIVLSPVLAAVSLSVRMKLGRPVLFAQERPGKDEKLFRLYKFRTMTDAYGEDGMLLPDEERLTDFGRKLRSSSLDELPELWNIAKGDMSIVGPRPLLAEYLLRYNERQRHRHDVRPGLTGLAQVRGRNSISWDEKFKEDYEYVGNITFANDCKIILKTISVVLKKSGISSNTAVTMEKYYGNNTAGKEAGTGR